MVAGVMDEYATDIVAWSQHQGALLRRRAAGELINESDLDWPHIAEEIESLGRSERRALESHVRTIIEHLAKLVVSPARDPRAGWEDTVLRARIDVDALLRDSPSLRPSLVDVMGVAHEAALRLAASSLRRHGEQPRAPLDELGFSVEQVLGPWLPDESAIPPGSG